MEESKYIGQIKQMHFAIKTNTNFPKIGVEGLLDDVEHNDVRGIQNYLTNQSHTSHNLEKCVLKTGVDGLPDDLDHNDVWGESKFI